MERLAALGLGLTGFQALLADGNWNLRYGLTLPRGKGGRCLQLTLVFVKPDGVRRALVGRVLTRLEEKGLEVRGLKCMLWTRNQAEKFYAEHWRQEYFSRLVEHMTSGPLVAAVLSGEDAVERARQVIGDTAGTIPGTIRGDWADNVTRNLVHGADSVPSAQREMALLFAPEEVL